MFVNKKINEMKQDEPLFFSSISNHITAKTAQVIKMQLACAKTESFHQADQHRHRLPC